MVGDRIQDARRARAYRQQLVGRGLVLVACDWELWQDFKQGSDSIRLITELQMLCGEETAERQSGRRMSQELIAGVSVKDNVGMGQVEAMEVGGSA